ncbi:MAG: hypothetical protein ACOC3V_02015, partial [bacterium]
LELEDDISCDWEPINKISHYIQDGKNDIEDWEYLYAKMDNEGFHYCFKHYSNWENIKDRKFHELRLDYLKTSQRLKEYIEDKIDNLRYD